MRRRPWRGTTSRPVRPPAASASGRRWPSSVEIDDVAGTWFAEETYVHYDEHAEHITAFADSLPA